ncbi:dihydrolipoamide dehydrogenase [Naumannella cuiyingiana]|uniref:NAD(P)H dehydrogenase (quinone) n=1 Tax=Naumannella cuiyingiana TaxID=1347891 RepID=A0A7Z0IK64_9ACTN|nr:dihydrolipoamide dehydrogenase [Naumannella cuiyingiana]
MTRVVIVGGGPGGYEAALVASQLGGEVTLVEEVAPGGSSVLTDAVPSKTLIATSDVMDMVRTAGTLGIRVREDAAAEGDSPLEAVEVDLDRVNTRVRELARAQSRDIARSLGAAGVTVIAGRGRLADAHTVQVRTEDDELELPADVILIATGTHPRILPTAQPDGERILTWTQLYHLDELPERLIVVGSGVTGAEFASAYDALGSDVVLVSSRDTVLPGEDSDAAKVLQDVFERRGMEVMSRSRAESVTRDGDEVVVTLTDGREVRGSHCLIAVGSIPNTSGIGLVEAGVELDDNGFVVVDKVSRTTAPGVYAAGDCTGVLMLASVAAMQGRKAMWHALGDAVTPLDLAKVASNVFTAPEIATVGFTQKQFDEGALPAERVILPLARNPRAKMQAIDDGLIKLFVLPLTGIIVGGVVVAPKASELIHPISLAVSARMTVDDFMSAFTVYPSLTGSLAEAARQLHRRGQVGS